MLLFSSPISTTTNQSKVDVKYQRENVHNDRNQKTQENFFLLPIISRKFFEIAIYQIIALLDNFANNAKITTSIMNSGPSFRNYCESLSSYMDYIKYIKFK